jgi:hypothetical protein
MRRLAWLIAAVGLSFVLAAPLGAQDYRARVQGTVTDSSQGTLPGTTVTLLNQATRVSVTATTDEQGQYLFDFVEPGMYSVSASIGGFKAVQLENIRVQQRQTLTVDLPMEVGGVEERVIVEAPPVTVQFKSGSAEINLERQLIDQAPIAGRNPYNLSNLDPTIVVSPSTNENRPYHHAYANDYDAGGGTRRGNDVLLDGVPLVASYKTAYTPAVDAVEEITVSKASVDAENGQHLQPVHINRRSRHAARRPPAVRGQSYSLDTSDPTALKMLNELPLPNQPGNVDNWQGAVYDITD